MYFPNRLQSNFTVKMDTLEIQAIQQIAKANDLKFSYQFGQPGRKGHCLAICFNFIKKYLELSSENTSDPILLKDKVISEMGLEKGVNASCAKTSVIYDNLFQNNCHQKLTDEEGSRNVLAALRQAVANTLGLSVVSHLSIEGSIEEIYDYLIETLDDGEYVITLPAHLVTLIKRDDDLFIINPGGDLIEVNRKHDHGKNELFNFLVRFKVPSRETLSLSKVEKQSENRLEISEKKVIISDQSSMESIVTPIKNKKDWAKREVIWRDRKYTFIEHTPSGEIYNGNSIKLLRTKLIILAAGRTAVETVARVVYHAALFVFRGFCFAALKAFTTKNTKILKLQTTQSFIDIFRSAIYGVAMIAVSFYGIYKPYAGRRAYAKLEDGLNRGQSTREKWYTAPCFIPLAKEANWKSPRMVRHMKRINQLQLQIANSCHPIKRVVKSLKNCFRK